MFCITTGPQPQAGGQPLLRFDQLLSPADLRPAVAPFALGHPAAFANVNYDDPAAVLKQAVFASYVVDWRWLATALPESVSSVTVSTNWLPETRDSEDPIATFAEGSQLIPWTSVPGGDPVARSGGVRVVHPPLGTGLMHAKLMLLNFGTFLRIVVSSANLTLDDWSNLGQAVWFVDVPRNCPGAASTGAPLQRQFASVLTLLGIITIEDPSVAALMTSFDWSATAGIARVVLSVPLSVRTQVTVAARRQAKRNSDDDPKVEPPGERDDEIAASDEDEEDGVHGQPAISQSVCERYQSLGAEFGGSGLDSLSSAVAWARAELDARGLTVNWASHPVVFQASSVGGISDDLLRRFDAAVGAPTRVCFPSLGTVRRQLGHGNVGAITLRCFQGSATELQRQRWHDFVTGDVPMHSKVIAHGADCGTSSSQVGWVYAGSHNFTADCWAFTRKEAVGSESDPRNFELGVLLPVAPQPPHGFGTCLPPSFCEVLRREESGPRGSQEALPNAQRGKPDPFVFAKHRHLVLEAGQMRGLPASEGPLAPCPEHYHWSKFASEYSNPYGRH